MLRSRPSEELPPQMTGVPKAYSAGRRREVDRRPIPLGRASPVVDPFQPCYRPPMDAALTAPSPLALDSARPPFERAASHLPGTAHRRVTSGQSPTTERAAQRYYTFRIRHAEPESGGRLRQGVEKTAQEVLKVVALAFPPRIRLAF